MSSLRGTSVLVFALVLASPHALAVADETPQAPGSAPSPMDALRGAGAAFGSAASAAADGVASAGAAVGSGIASAAAAVAEGVTALAALAGAALAAAGRGLVALAGAIAELAVGLARGAADLAVATVTSIAAFALAVAGLAQDGARWVAAHPRESLVATAAAGGAGSLYGLVSWLRRLGLLSFVPLYSRLAPSEILNHPQRAEIFNWVREHPGATVSSVQQRFDLGWGTAVYHLDRLEGSRLLAAKRSGNRKCYFVAGGEFASPDLRAAVSALQTPRALDIAKYVAVHPGTSQKALAESLGLSAALTSWHVKRLAAAGVLEARREGRGTALFARAGLPGVPGPDRPGAPPMSSPSVGA